MTNQQIICSRLVLDFVYFGNAIKNGRLHPSKHKNKTNNAVSLRHVRLYSRNAPTGT